MIVYAFGDFMDKDLDEGECAIYLVRDDEKVLYVGKAQYGVWNRWFDGTRSHMARNFEGQWFGNSKVGEAIAHALPVSREWQIELYTASECLGKENNAFWNYYDGAVDMAEAEMIRKYRPRYNSTLSS